MRRGAILNVGPDGSLTVNSRAQSASPGSFISVFVTGLGHVHDPPGAGAPARADPLSYLHYKPSGLVGAGSASSDAPAQFAGFAPGLAGVDQMNLRLREEVPEGCAVPICLNGATTSTQTVTIAIRKGGGQCADLPWLESLNYLDADRLQRTGSAGPMVFTAGRSQPFFCDCSPDGACSGELHGTRPDSRRQPRVGLRIPVSGVDPALIALPHCLATSSGWPSVSPLGSKPLPSTST
jgi:hypothetical protein